MKNLIVGLLIVSAFCLSCKKVNEENNTINPGSLKGKLKSYEFIDSGNVDYKLHFIYDTLSGQLKSVRWGNKEVISIGEKINNTISIKTTSYRPSDTLFLSTLERTAYVNGNHVDKLMFENPFTHILIPYYTIYNSPAVDSMVQNVEILPGSFVYENVQFNHPSDNIISCSEDNITKPPTYPIDPIQYFHSTSTVEYYNYENPGLIPYQLNSSLYFNENTFAVPMIDALYVLSLNQYTGVHRNKNLIKSFVSDQGDDLQFSYVFNTLNQIAEMKIVLQGTKEVTFRFEYY